MTSRYDNEQLKINASSIYRKKFIRRNIGFVNQYGTPTIPYHTDEQLMNITLIPHVWKVGDRFYKLAHKYYEDSSLWWIIAWFNRLPTESEVEIGDSIDIPLPLDYMLELWES